MTRRRRGMLCFLKLQKLLASPRSVWLLLAAAAVNMTYLMSMRAALGEAETMSFLTPLLLILASPQDFPSPHFFLSAFVFFLLSQIPMTDEGFHSHLIREDRKTWLRGELTLIVAANLSMLVFFFLMSIAVMLPRVSLSVAWDDKLPVWQDIQRGSWGTAIPYAVIYQASQVRVLACAAGLWLLYSVFGGLVMLAARLAAPRQRYLGIGVLFCVYFYDYICEYFLPYASRYLSPVALSRISYLNWGYDPIYPSIGYAFAFFSAGCLALVAIVYCLGRKVDLDKLSSRANR